MTLEELIRDRAGKGEMVHLSLYHEISSGLWCATYAPAHEFGNSTARHKDPVTACEQAITAPKTKRKVTAAVKEPNAAQPNPADIDAWLPRP